MHSILPRAYSGPFLILWLVLDMKEVSLHNGPMYSTRSHTKSERLLFINTRSLFCYPRQQMSRKSSLGIDLNHGLNSVTLRSGANQVTDWTASHYMQWQISHELNGFTLLSGTKKVTGWMALNYMQEPTNSLTEQKDVACRGRIGHGLNRIKLCAGTN